MRDLLLLQLGFNILILTALLVLGRPRRRKASSKKEPTVSRLSGLWTRARKRLSAPREVAAPKVAAVPDIGLDHLIEKEERKELVAEQALRARLGRFKARAVG